MSGEREQKEVSPMELALNLTAELLAALTGPGYCVLCDHAPKRGIRIVDSVAEHNHDCVAASVRNRLTRMRTAYLASRAPESPNPTASGFPDP